MIQLTPVAAQEIQRIRASRQQSEDYLRLGVKQGGCSGLYYTLDLSQTVSPSDRRYESEGIPILVDEMSDIYLQNLKLDYGEDLMGGGFRFHNPKTESTCSCGLSFTYTPSEH